MTKEALLYNLISAALIKAASDPVEGEETEELAPEKESEKT